MAANKKLKKRTFSVSSVTVRTVNNKVYIFWNQSTEREKYTAPTPEVTIAMEAADFMLCYRDFGITTDEAATLLHVTHPNNPNIPGVLRGATKEGATLPLTSVRRVEFTLANEPGQIDWLRVVRATPVDVNVGDIDDLREYVSNAIPKGEPPAWPTRPLDPVFTPVQLPGDGAYRLLNDKVTRIGYANLKSPISVIKQQRSANPIQQETLRSSSSVKKGLGHAYENYVISYMANGPAEIQAGVRDVIEQISLMPFLPVEGGPFGVPGERGDIDTKAIAVRNFNVSTVPGFPNQLQVDIMFDPFIWEWYLQYNEGRNGKYARSSFSDAFCWPLFKLWCKSAEKSSYSGKPFNNKISFSFPTLAGTKKLLRHVSEAEEDTLDVNDDKTTLNDLIKLIGKGNGPEYKGLTSPYVKEIKPVAQTTTRLFAIKVSSKSTFDSFVENPNVYYYGLIDWTKIKDNQAFGGKLIPQSFMVTEAQLVPGASPHNVLEHPYEDSDTTGLSIDGQKSIIDVRANQDWKKEVRALIRANIAALITPGFLGDPNPEIDRRTEEKFAEVLASPQNYYAIVVRYNTADESSRHRLVQDMRDRLQKEVYLKNPKKKTDVENPVNSTKIEGEYVVEPDIETVLAAHWPTHEKNNESLVIEAISATKSHNIVAQSNQAIPLPRHESCGGHEVTFIIKGTCFGTEAKQAIEDIQRVYEERALKAISSRYKSSQDELSRKTAGPFMKVENEIFNLMGVEWVMPTGLNITSVEGQPGVWEFTMMLLELPPELRRQEQVRFITTPMGSNAQPFYYGNTDIQNTGRSPIVDKAREYFSLEGKLAVEEVAKDLKLPKLRNVISWINGCRDLAKRVIQFKKTKPGTIVSGLSNVTPSNETETFIRNTIPEFFENDETCKEISEWLNGDGAFPPEYLRNAFAETDFYIYYLPEYTFGANFDDMAEDRFGPRKSLRGSFREAALEEKKKGQISNVTKTDTRHPVNITLVEDPSLRSARADVLAEGMQRGVNARLFPKDVSQEILKIKENTEDSYDTTYDNVRWWQRRGESGTVFQTNTEEVKKNKQIPVSIVDTLSESGNLLIPQPIRGSGDTDLPEQISNFYGDFGRTGGNQQDSFELDRDQEGRVFSGDKTLDFRQFFEINWRRSISKYAANFKKTSAPRSNKSFTESTQAKGFLIGAPQELDHVIGYLLRGEGPFGQRDSENPKDGQPMTLRETVDYRLSLATKADQFSGPVMHIGSFLVGTMEATSSYKYYLKNDFKGDLGKEFRSSGNAKESLERHYNLTQSIAAKYRVDPNLIRAYFLARSAFGTGVAAGSTKEDGWGDLHTSFTDKTMNGQVSLFAKTLASNMVKFNNVTTIALLATDIELTSKRETLFENGKMSAKMEKDLLAFSRVIGLLEVGKADSDTVESIAGLLRTYDEKGVITFYLEKYYEVSRSYGSVYDPSSFKHDAFFNPLSYFILLDIYSDANTPPVESVNIVGLGQELLLLPGRGQGIDGMTGNAAIQGKSPQREIDGGSAELNALNRKRLNAGLDPHTEDAVWGALYDFRKHSAFGRLSGAFPTFCVLIVNEGWYWQGGNQRLWDQYYVRGGVASIEVEDSTHMPGGVCNVTFSNMFHQLTAYAMMEGYAHDIAVRNSNRLKNKVYSTGLLSTIVEEFSTSVLRNLNKDLLSTWQNNHFRELALSPGARLHVRMGHSSNAADLPVVFNGTVVDVPVSHGMVSVTAVSDGGELDKQSVNKLEKVNSSYAYVDSPITGVGKPPSSIVAEALVALDGIVPHLAEGKYFRDFSSGIVHFGDPIFDGIFHTASETQLNIYNSRNGALEQTIPSVQNYFSTNALYNWNNEVNYFSVSVNQPTPWKVIQTCRRACLDFVAAARPFGMRQTLFFGKWWWPFNYAYTPSILEQDRNIGFGNFAQFRDAARAREKARQSVQENGVYTGNEVDGEEPTEEEQRRLREYRTIRPFGRQGVVGDDFTGVIGYEYARRNNPELARQMEEDWNNSPEGPPPTVVPNSSGVLNNTGDSFAFDYLRDVEALVKHTLWKPFSQVHVAHSLINLLSTDIQASSASVYTDAIPIVNQNGFLGNTSISKKITFSLDSIPGYVPVTIKDADGFIDILPIEDLVPVFPTSRSKKHYGKQSFKVLDKNGFVEVLNFMAHKTDKSIYRVNALCEDRFTEKVVWGGTVDVTADHSLMDISGQEMSPTQAKGKYGLNVICPGPFINDTSIDEQRAFIIGLYLGSTKKLVHYPECYTKYSRVERIPKSILNAPESVKRAFVKGFNEPSSDKVEKYNYILAAQIRYLKECLTHAGEKNPLQNNVVLFNEVEVIPPDKNSYVYDFHTESNTFCAGVGNIWVHNTDIQAGQRKTQTVETGLLLTAVQDVPGTLRNIAGGVLNWIPGMNEFITETPTTPAVNNSAVSFLVDSAKEMYQGWFTITGNGAIKPHDFIYLSDTKHQLDGPVSVKTVVHVFNAQTGFVSIISPNACVFPKSSTVGIRLLDSIVNNFLRQYTAYFATRGMLASVKYGLTAKFRKLSGKNNAVYKRMYEDLEIKSKGAKVRTGTIVDDVIDNLDTVYAKQIDQARRAGDEKRAVELIDQFKKAEAGLLDELSKAQSTSSQTDFFYKAKEIGKKYKLTLDFDKYLDIGGTEDEAKLIKNFLQFKQDLRTNLTKDITTLLNSQGVLLELDVDGNVSEATLRKLKPEVVRQIDEFIFRRQIAFVEKNNPELKKLLRKKDFSTLDADTIELINKGLKDTPIYIGGKNTGPVNRLLDDVFPEIRAFREASVGRQGIGDLSAQEILDELVENGSITDELIKARYAKLADEAANAADSPSTVLKTFNWVKSLGKGKELRKLEQEGKEIFRVRKILEEVMLVSKFASVMGPVAILKVLAQVGWFVIGNGLVDSISARLSARECVTILPLKAGNVPYTAGIRGHAGSVIGDEPGWLDQLISGTLGGSRNGSLTIPDSLQWIGLAANFIGIEAPDIEIATEAEQRWLQEFLKDEEVPESTPTTRQKTDNVYGRK